MKRMIAVAMVIAASAGVAGGEPAGPPAFSVGDTWKRSNGQELTVMRVDEQGTAIAGVLTDCRACLVVFDKNYIPLSITDAEGKPVEVTKLRAVFVGPDWKWYDWPLEAKKTWDVSAKAFTRGGSVQNVTIRNTVLAYEDVKIKAGTFKAYKLQRDWSMNWPGFAGSSWTTMVWYAPEVKSVVKETSTNPNITDWELVSYSVR